MLIKRMFLFNIRKLKLLKDIASSSRNISHFPHPLIQIKRARNCAGQPASKPGGRIRNKLCNY